MSSQRRETWIPKSAKWSLGALLAIVALWLGGWLIDGVLLGGDGVPRGVELAVPDAVDVDGSMGGLSADDVSSRVDELAASYSELRVDVTVDDESVPVGFAQLGLNVDAEATKQAVLAVERGGPIGWTQGWLSPVTVSPRFNFDRDVARTTLISNAPVGEPPIEPLMVLADDTFELEPGVSGTAFDVDQAVEILEENLGGTDLSVKIEPVPLDPTLSDAEVLEFVQIANAITSKPLTVTLEDQEITISPITLRSWLDLETRVGNPSFTINDTDVMNSLRFAFPEAGGGGTDATIDVIDDVPTVVPGVPGTACCDDSSPQRILEAMVAGQSMVNLALGEAGLDRDEEFLTDLGIIEVIGEFTTNYTAGQARVTNIQRIAELTQGVIIEPGDTFSVNDFVGRRTRDKGFVSAGVIQDGVFKDDIGGGISQYATTLFNAAFFGGLDIDDYRAHSIYISRYPYGREATLAYGAIDLAITNNTPYGVMIWPVTDDAGITVKLYSTKFVSGEQTGQWTGAVEVACTRVNTERTRTYLDGRDPVIDVVYAVYRPEGIKCNGESSLPESERPPATTIPPATVPPATIPPATVPPGTQPPATTPPNTKKPRPPATQPPATQPPATQPPPATSTP